MSKLYFKVASDWQEVVRLRNEIAKLESQIKSMDANKAPQAVAVLNHQMQQTKQQMQGMITEAAKAGAVMESDFKSKIYQSSQAVNDFTQKIINQKAIVKDVEADVKRLGEAYRSSLKNNPLSASGKLSEYTSAKKALDEEKAALFGLTQEQANARLSVKKLRDEYALFRDDSKETVSTTDGIGFSLKKAFAVIGGAALGKEFLSNMVRVKGEFQAADTAIQTLLGNKEKADALMSQVKDFAKISPLEFSDVTAATQMMLGFNIEADKVPRYLQAIGDVSMGNTQKFNSLTLAFSQMSAAGKLMGQDLNQMINAGFNPLSFMSEKTGKSIAVLKDEMSKGAISAEMVQQAFVDATSAGGKFYQMSENASKTINGQLSMMQDAIDATFNELGTKSEGVIMSGIQMTTKLVDNYETIGKVLAGLIATYGAYRTAVMLTTIATGKHTIAEVALTNVRVLARKAQLALNASMLTNPYVLLATVIVGAAAAMWTFHDGTTAAEKAQKKFNKEKEEAAKREEAHKSHIESLISAIQDETTAEINRIGAMDKLKAAYPHIFAKYVDEKGHLRDIIGYKKEIAEFDSKVSVGVAKRQADRAKNDLILVNKEINYRQGSTTGASKYFRNKTTSELREMQSELLESYQLKQSEYDKLADLEAKAKIKSSSSTITQDKSYREKQKKDAQAKLDALSDIEASGKKGAALKQKITEYDKKISAFSSSTSKQESSAEKLRKQQEKSAEELLSLRRQNQQDEINLMKEGSDKKLKQIELDYQKELDAIKKQESDWSKVQKGKLTQEQTVEISTRYTNTESKKEKSIGDNTKERLIAEQQALNEYLTKYGTFQQQKLAIAQEYAEKIKKAQEESGINSTQVKLLQREQHEKTSAIDVASIKANMDWVAVFGEFGGMFSDMIKPALEDAKKYIKTDEFKNSDQSDQKALIDAINQMEKSLGGSGGLNFKKLGQDVQIYQNSLRDLNTAKEEEIDAINKLKKAQEDYEKTIKGGTEQEKQTAKDALDNAQINADTASANVKAQTNIVNQNQQGLSDTATNLKANMNNVAEGLSKLASGGIKSAYDGIIQAGKGMGGSIEKVAKSLEDVPIIGWIISIIDVLKDGLSNLVGGLLDAIFNAVSGIISDVLSGDLFVTIGESLATGISKILDAITFGGFGSWTNAGESDETLKDDIELLSKSNEDLKAAIDNLAEKMDSASVADATDLYKQQKENLQKQLTNTQEMMQRSGAAYSNGWIGIGGSHSSNAKINSSMSSDDWSRISGVIGRTINNAGDFWNLTSEQMAKVAMDATDLYTKIKSYADDGYEDAGQYMDSYIKYYKQLEELENAWREKLTSSSFDTIRDDFKSALMDMEADTEDFAANFEELMKNAIFESLMTKKYDALLQSWYKDFASAMDGGELTEDEQRNLKKSWEDIVNQGIAERDALYDTMGWDKTTSSSTSQDSTKGGFDTMSQDTGEELNGRFTALQIAGEEIKNQSTLQSQSLNLLTMKSEDILRVNSEIRNIADETRDLIANSYLELVQISENTGAIIKPIRDMAADIAEVKKNTSKL